MRYIKSKKIKRLPSNLKRFYSIIINVSPRLYDEPCLEFNELTYFNDSILVNEVTLYSIPGHRLLFIPEENKDLLCDEIFINSFTEDINSLEVMRMEDKENKSDLITDKYIEYYFDFKELLIDAVEDVYKM